MLSKTTVAKSLALALCLGLTSAASAQVRIGFLGTISGPSGSLGQDQYDAFMLAIENSGGKLGGQAVEVIKEDDQLKPELAVQTAQRMVSRDHVQIVAGMTFSNVLMAVLRPFTEKGVFVVGSNAGPAPLAGKDCSPYFFSTSYTNENNSEAMGAYAQQRYKKMLLLAPNYQAGKDSLSGFKRYYKGGVIDELYTQLNQADYQGEISRIRTENPDAIFVFYPGGMGINFIKQYRQSGLLGKIPLLSASTVDGTTLPAVGDVAIGTITMAHWGPDFDNPANKKFVETFEKKYGRIPSIYAASSYDSAMLIGSVLNKVKGDLGDKDAVRAAFKAADYESVRGPYRYNNNGFPIQDYYSVEVGRDSQGRVSMVTKDKVLSAHADAYGAKECTLK